MEDSIVNCDLCQGSGQTIRGYDGRRIRCPKCLGNGVIAWSELRRRVTAPSGRDRSATPTEYRETYRQVRKPTSCASKIPGKLLSWALVPIWFLLGVMGGIVVVPGTGEPKEVPSIILNWLMVALIWLGTIAILLVAGIFLGFIETHTWPWQFVVPNWLRNG